MAEETIETRLNYPHFTKRNYVVALHNPQSTTFIDPLSFLLGRWRIAPAAEKREMLKGWIEFEPTIAEWLGAASEGKRPVFDPGREVYIHEDGTKKRIRINSLDMPKLMQQMERWVRDGYANNPGYGNLNFMREGYPEIFGHLEVRAYGGEIWLGGGVRRKGRVVSEGITRGKFHHVSIAGPYIPVSSAATPSKFLLGMVDCDCEESKENLRKSGYSNAGYTCIEAAALLNQAANNPKSVRHLLEVMNRRHVEIWTPFHAYRPQHYPEALITTRQDIEPNLSNLVVTALINFLTRRDGENKAELNNLLLKINTIMDPRLRAFIESGKANIEVIANEWMPHRLNRSDPVYRWYDSMNDGLSQRGYRLTGLVLEKKDSEFETVAIDYVKGGSSVRLLFLGGLPPLEVYRKALPERKADVFAMEKEGRKASRVKPFYEELFEPKIIFDDKTRRYTLYEVRIPIGIWLPQEMMPDYYRAIQYYIKGGLEKLRKQVNEIRPSMLKKTHFDLYDSDAFRDRVNLLINTIDKYGRI